MTNWKPKGAINCTTQVELRVLTIQPYREMRFAFENREQAIAAAEECKEHFGPGKFLVAEVLCTVHRVI